MSWSSGLGHCRSVLGKAALAAAFGWSAGCVSGPAAGPDVAVELRAEDLTVTPATGPLVHVRVRNPGGRPWAGTVEAAFPATWQMNRTSHTIKIGPGETARLAFAIERGTDAEDNAYPVALKAVSEDGTEATRTQTIRVASAPFYKPVIDGDTADWADSIPVAFVTGGKRTEVRTYWNRAAFCVLAAVEEDAHRALDAPAAGGPDAVQIALAPRTAVTPDQPSQTDRRYEFLLAATAAGPRCYLLMRPDMTVAAAAEARPLEGHEWPDAQLAVTRKDGVTYYECALPLEAMPLIRAEPGREFYFSVLVHDDGTGLRDRGEDADLWAVQRKPFAWCRWQGARWPAEPPFDSKVEWGFCSSKK
jgi:hypothetical protein